MRRGASMANVHGSDNHTMEQNLTMNIPSNDATTRPTRKTLPRRDTSTPCESQELTENRSCFCVGPINEKTKITNQTQHY